MEVLLQKRKGSVYNNGNLNLNMKVMSTENGNGDLSSLKYNGSIGDEDMANQKHLESKLESVGTQGK